MSLHSLLWGVGKIPSLDEVLSCGLYSVSLLCENCEGMQMDGGLS